MKCKELNLPCLTMIYYACYVHTDLIKARAIHKVLELPKAVCTKVIFEINIILRAHLVTVQR